MSKLFLQLESEGFVKPVIEKGYEKERDFNDYKNDPVRKYEATLE
jgi:hypothetical protein